MKYLILGASLRGLPQVAETLSREGHEVLLFDSETAVEARTGTEVVLGPSWSKDYLVGVDTVVTSPWFSEIRPPLSDVIDAGTDVITEAGFGLEHITMDYVAVTGTNGKTTVTEAAAAMLVASGIDAVSAGNIGTPVSALTDGDAEVAVLELSSYQLRFMGVFSPSAAALLNIAEDHLDWHGSVDAYIAAKASIFATMSDDAILAYNADDPVVVNVVAEAKCELVPCSGNRMPTGGNGVDNGHIVVAGRRYWTPTTDPSFLFDLVAAATIAIHVGATPEGVESVVSAFTPGDHRRRAIAVIDGVTWVNDSKATNPHATVAAARAYENVVLLAGGQNKDLNLAPLTDLPTVHTLIAFGEAAEEIASVADKSVLVATTMEDAFVKATEVVKKGDTVLLAPGCASFDEFASYAQRGDAFASLVRSHQEATS